MRFASRLRLAPEDLSEIAAAAHEIGTELGGPATLVTVFATPHFRDEAEEIAASVAGATGAGALVGCTAGGVVAGGREIEYAPAVSVWAAHMPGVEVDARHVEHVDSDGGSFVGAPEVGPDTSALLVLADPYTFPADQYCRSVDRDRHGLACIGGLASGGTEPGDTRLLLGKDVLDGGAVVAALSGAVEVHTLVSQGCRPIGRSLLVTAGERNVVTELGGRPALDRLVETVADMEPSERELIEGGLHIGRVVDEHKDEFGRGDFLIRNVVGIDRDSGALAIGDLVEIGSTVQFHVRDATTADEDLLVMLGGLGPSDGESGALLFTCNGRGRRFFGTADHDASAIEAVLGIDAVGGFFCAGEIGPVGGANHLHGYTAAIAVFTGG